LQEDPTFVAKEKEPESEYWHSKSLEVCCSFLPSDCPLVNHIILSYNKHHAPSSQVIEEGKESNDKLEVVKAKKGIDSTKFTPVIRRLDGLNVQVTPCNHSPASKVTSKLLTSYQSQMSVHGISAGPGGCSGKPKEQEQPSLNEVPAPLSADTSAQFLSNQSKNRGESRN